MKTPHLKIVKGLNFQDWKSQVNSKCESAYGMHLDDLPDMPFHDYFESGMSPQSFFDEFLGSVEMLMESFL